MNASCRHTCPLVTSSPIGFGGHLGRRDGPENKRHLRRFELIIRCRYRKSFEKPEPIVAGEVFKVTIEPFATANLFAKGHRIRLDISSSNFPKYDVNPNTYAPEGRGRTTQVARNTVFCDAARPSAIRLPIVSGEAMIALKPFGK